MINGEIGFLQWLLGIVFIGPFVWMWAKINRQEKRVDVLTEALGDIKEDTGYLRGRMEVLHDKQERRREDFS
jgi:hypothetical protein